MDSKEDAWTIVAALIRTAPSFAHLKHIGTTLVEDVRDYFGDDAQEWLLGNILLAQGAEVLEKVREGLIE